MKFLSEQRGISAEQAATLITTVSDCRVSQVVNIKKGIHCLNPKNPGAAEDMERPTQETPNYLVTHVRDASLDKAMDHLRGAGARREAAFRQAAEAERTKSDVLSRKFGEGLKRAKDDPDPPIRPIDLD